MPQDTEPSPVFAASARLASADTAGQRSSAGFAAHIADDRLVTRDGAVLPLRHWATDGAPRAIVLALHGFNDYSNAFADAGDEMARHGIETYAYDQRGFGRAPQRGRWGGTDRMVDDAVTAMTLLRARHPGVPLYVMGESMGGAVAILAANRTSTSDGRPNGFILLAPAVWGRDTMNVFERVGLWLADLMPHVEWSPDLIPMHIRPSDNQKMLRGLANDPLVIKTARSEALTGLVDLMSEALDAAPRFSVKSLILYGEQDQVVPRTPVARFVSALPPAAAARQRVAYYRAGYHLLLRDLEGESVLNDVIAWIDDPQAPLPSGADRNARPRLTGRPDPVIAGAPARPSAATTTRRTPS